MKKTNPLYSGLSILLLSSVLTGCGDDNDSVSPTDFQLTETIKANALKGDPIETAVAAGVAIPAMTDPKSN